MADHVLNIDKLGDGNDSKPESSKWSKGGLFDQNKNKKRKRARKLVVKYNSLGVPVGVEPTELSMYIGILARTSISILYNDWLRV